MHLNTHSVGFVGPVGICLLLSTANVVNCTHNPYLLCYDNIILFSGCIYIQAIPIHKRLEGSKYCHCTSTCQNCIKQNQSLNGSSDQQAKPDSLSANAYQFKRIKPGLHCICLRSKTVKSSITAHKLKAKTFKIYTLNSCVQSWLSSISTEKFKMSSIVTKCQVL